MSDNQVLGKKGEQIASKFLSKKGFKIQELNFHKHWGEIDIICLDPSTGSGPNGTLVFVEVKTRMQWDRISPEQSITKAKIHTLKTCALFYKKLHQELPDLLRIDFVGITLDESQKPVKINHIKNITS